MQEYACIEGDNSVRLTINGLVRTFTDPEYAKRWREEMAEADARAAARGGRRGGGPAGAAPAGAAPPGRGAGAAGQ
jgi:NADPH-dependent glutamate synthase beta subunit-like oxidoreductase